MARIKLTKTVIDALPLPETGRKTYWDTELKGFCIRISKTAKTYYAKKRLGAKSQWVKIGEHGAMTPSSARKEALKTLSDLNRGIDVNREKAKARKKGLTLSKVMEKYLETKPDLRSSTVESYKNLINSHLESWLDKTLTDITGEMVSHKHLDIAKKNGQAQSNKVMRVLRLLLNYYGVMTGKPFDNPVRRLSASRQWFKIERRQTVIKEHELKAWHEALMDYSNPIVSDAIFLLLLTGCRENEMLTLLWSDVDMKDRTFTIRAEIAKNHRAHTLPMSNVIFDIFNQRLALSENDWVFPGTGPKGHLIDMRRAVESVIKKSGVDFCLHDLRRTFTSIAEQEVSYAILKRLLNHYIGNDVTAGYLVIPVENLRAPMQKITNRILKAINQPEEMGKVIQLRT